MINKLDQAKARKLRVRHKLLKQEKPRLSVFRSNKFTYAQIVEPGTGVIIAAASDKELKDGKAKTKSERAAKVGELVAEKALKKKVKKVMFDRGAYRYHGRVKALAEAARAAGLEF